MKISTIQLLDFLRARYYFQDTPTFLQEILQQYPMFKYQGPAYRSVILGVDEKFIKKPEKFRYASFAKTFSGINAFLINYYNEGTIDVNKVVLVEASVMGLDLTLVIKHLEESGLILDEVIYQLKREEEIIAVEVSELQKIPNEHLWHHQVLGELEPIRDHLGYLLERGLIGCRDWRETLHQIKALNFLNHLLGINNQSLAQADFYLSTVKPNESSFVIGQKLHELGFVIPEPYRDLIS